MRILIALALVMAVMAGLTALILAIGTAVAKAGGDTGWGEPGAVVPRVAFGVLWLLVAGVAAGLIGGA
jgi:hypothetical protein